MTKSESKGSGVDKEAKDFPPPNSLTHGYRPRCFFDIQINKVDAGRVVFELFSDICPKTCENFRALCTGEKGEGKTTFKPLHYKNTILHRIVKRFILQGGDFVSGDGTGGESIYGGQFKDENFELQHDRAYLLSMANCGPNTNGSQFFITLAASHHLDNIHTVFGHVLSGQDIIRDIENQKVNSNHKPYADVRISHCGELIKKLKSQNVKSKPTEAKKHVSSSSSSESDSDSEAKRKKRHKKKKSKEKDAVKSKKSEKEKQSSNVDRSSTAATEPVEGDLNFIPSVPSTFLMRRSRTPSPIRERRRLEGQVPARQREPALRTRVNMVSKSGKKLRGRGVMRYRTPSPDSSDAGSEPEGNGAQADQGTKSKDNSERFQADEKAGASSTRNFSDRNIRRSRSRSFGRRSRRKSRSRSREIRRRRSRSKSLDNRRSSRHSPSPWRRHPKRQRHRSRSHSRPKYSRSPVRRRRERSLSQDRKGKFDRHHSDSGSLSESSHVFKIKQKKDSQDNTMADVAEKKPHTIMDNREPVGRQNKSDELDRSKVVEYPLCATGNVQSSLSLKSSQAPFQSNEVETLFPTGINNDKSIAEPEMHDDFIATSIEEENIPGYLFDQGKENSFEPNPVEAAADEEVSVDVVHKEGTETAEIDPSSEVVPSIEPKSEGVSTSDNFAQSCENAEELATVVDHVDEPALNDNEPTKLEVAPQVPSESVLDDHFQSDIPPVHDEPAQLVDEIIKSKEKIGALQEQIKEFEEFKLRLGVPTVHSEDNDRLDLPQKKTISDSNDSHDNNGGTKLDTNDVLIGSSHGKRSRNRHDSDSSEISDRHSRGQKRRGHKKLKKKAPKKYDSSESSMTEEVQYDSDDESSESEEESPAEADRDHKKSRKRKHKSKRERNRRASNIKNKATHKKKKYHSDNSSESSSKEYGKRVKKHRKKHRNDSSSEYSSDSDYDSKKKMKLYTRRKDSKRSRNKSLRT